ncbi:MAG: aldo/keto reductase [Nocardioides sp.]|uniref:aldo/keto reductase n=1 Tax=Nocardioides sp. TaxID=35761 RepID=UPI0039E587F9
MRGDDLIALGAPAAGTGRFVLGGAFGTEPAEDSFAKLDRFAAAGGRLVETAYSYARGRGKQVVGEWLRRNPGTLGVVTKIGHDMGGRDVALTRATVLAQAGETVDVLGEPPEVVLFHCDDPAREVEELGASLRALVEQGYAARVGVSNWCADRLAALVTDFASAGASAPIAGYHRSLATPVAERYHGELPADAAVLEIVEEHRLPLFSWSAQARGFFARTGSASSSADPYESATNRARRERCRTLAAELGVEPGQVALAWSLACPLLWPSIGPRTLDQLADSLAAATVELTAEQRAWLVG